MRRGIGRVVVTGLIATVVAATATTVGAAIAKAAGVDFQVSGGEAIPVGAFATVTAFFSLVGVVIAVALVRWSGNPANRFVQVAVALTAASLVPPFLAGANPSTTATLVLLHLLAAGVVIPALTRALRATRLLTTAARSA